MFQRCGRLRSDGSTASNGMPSSDRSQRRLLSRICVARRGRNGKKRDATAIESMLPKLDLEPMRTYFSMFANVGRPESDRGLHPHAPGRRRQHPVPTPNPRRMLNRSHRPGLFTSIRLLCFARGRGSRSRGASRPPFKLLQRNKMPRCILGRIVHLPKGSLCKSHCK
jgi:hypothetical protein